MAKRKRRKTKAKPISKVRLIVYLVLAVFVAVAVFIGWTVRDLDFAMTNSMGSSDLDLTSILYWQDPKDGEWKDLEYLSSGDKRLWADIDEIPNWLEDAFVAIEDQRFYSHKGVDWKRTMGAVFNEVFKGGSTYGGSSITQQLVKNITGERDRKYTRKIKEIIRALAVETKLSKQQILELYLNTIYLGHGCNGVESAARIYFDKPVTELTLAESASIAGITQYPSLYDPHKNKEENIKKQRLVLSKMLELGYIDQEDYDKAVAEELKFVKGDELLNVHQSYFADQIAEDVIADLMKEFGYDEAVATKMVFKGGLKIYTTADKRVQSQAEVVFENEANFPSSGGSELQAAIVVTEPRTGYVKAIVGGRGEKTGSRVLNRATQTVRQSGSSIKPLSVYAPAIDLELITMDSFVADEPINIGGWQPKNYYNAFYGNISVRRAVNVSANIPAVKVLQKVGVNKSFDYMTNKLHFTTLVDKETRDGKVYTDKNLASLALGGFTHGVTVEEMTAAYGAFANDGVYISPITYTKVEDNMGKTLLTKKPVSNVAFKPTTAYITNQLLKGVVTSGTAAGSSIPGIDTGGKTGTTDDDTDRWFAGYTPYYSAVVWVGYDSSKPLPSFGSNPALNLWRKVMTKIHQGLPGKSFTQPSGIKSVSVCSMTGKLYTETCFNNEGASTEVFSYYTRGTVPREKCNGHGLSKADMEAAALVEEELASREEAGSEEFDNAGSETEELNTPDEEKPSAEEETDISAEDTA